MKKVIAIVDGFNAGRFFPIQLNKRALACIHISSAMMRNRKYDTSLYVDHFIEQTSLDCLLQQIKSSYQCDAVIAGSESGVILAHQLARKFKLRRNKDELIHATRDKFAMQQALKSKQISAVNSFKSNDLASILAWVESQNVFPVVVKPLDSGGSDNVHICKCLSEIEEAYHAIRNNKTIYGQYVNEVLIQEYLVGNEYVVNLVSFAGKHFLLELRKYHKQLFNGKHIYDFEELLDFNGEVQQVLITYAKQVADAVGIQYGPSHIEIIMTDNGPRLVEIAARISGATNVEVSNAALGYNVVDLTIDSYLNSIEQVSNQLQQTEIIIDIATNFNGKIVAIPFKDTVTKFDSIKSAYFKLEVGDEITPTVSLPTSPVKIHLLHKDKTKLLEDKDALKKAAENGFVIA